MKKPAESITHLNNGGSMDTGYPALISDPLVTPHEPQAQKTSCGLVPDESSVVSAPSEPTGSPPTIANAS
jgi:hypothetical protein